MLDGQFDVGGRVAVNTSGGLIARGHPGGATGLAQIVELTHAAARRGRASSAQPGQKRSGTDDRCGRLVLRADSASRGRATMTTTPSGLQSDTYPELIATFANRPIDAVAVRDESTTLTYPELYERIGALAEWLSGLGVTAGDTVALMIASSAELLIAQLATQVVGAVGALVNTSLVGKALRHVIEIASPTIILADPDSAAQLSRESLQSHSTQDPDFAAACAPTAIRFPSCASATVVPTIRRSSTSRREPPVCRKGLCWNSEPALGPWSSVPYWAFRTARNPRNPCTSRRRSTTQWVGRPRWAYVAPHGLLPLR